MYNVYRNDNPITKYLLLSSINPRGFENLIQAHKVLSECLKFHQFLLLFGFGCIDSRSLASSTDFQGHIGKSDMFIEMKRLKGPQMSCLIFQRGQSFDVVASDPISHKCFNPLIAAISFMQARIVLTFHGRMTCVM